MRMHQSQSGSLFRDGFIDLMLQDIREGRKRLSECSPHIYPLERGRVLVPAMYTRCGQFLPVERIAYNFDEMDCRRCLYLTMGEGDEYERPIGDLLPKRLQRR